MAGQAQIISTLRQILPTILTAPYVSKVREVRLLNPDVDVLRAVVGMVPTGQSNLNPQLNVL